MSEYTAVQEPMLRYSDQIGWTHVSRSQAMQMRRGDTAALYFSDVLKAQLLKLNKGIVDDSNCDDVMRKLSLLNATLEGNQDSLLAVVETKNANKPDGLALGVEQIRRYHDETPEMFTTAQLFGVTQLHDFFYGVTWNTSRKNLFNWKFEEPTNYEQKVKTFFDRDGFLKVLQQSIIFQSRDDQLIKIVLRQHQTRAVEKVIERVHDPNKRRGLVWHTQGSGKTLTMITIAADSYAVEHRQKNLRC